MYGRVSGFSAANPALKTRSHLSFVALIKCASFPPHFSPNTFGDEKHFDAIVLIIRLSKYEL